MILEVQKRPILYDKALKGYRKPVTRENAWQDVSELLQSPGKLFCHSQKESRFGFAVKFKTENLVTRKETKQPHARATERINFWFYGGARQTACQASDKCEFLVRFPFKWKPTHRFYNVDAYLLRFAVGSFCPL